MADPSVTVTFSSSMAIPRRSGGATCRFWSGGCPLSTAPSATAARFAVSVPRPPSALLGTSRAAHRPSPAKSMRWALINATVGRCQPQAHSE
jgi:hypothetical protein